MQRGVFGRLGAQDAVRGAVVGPAAAGPHEDLRFAEHRVAQRVAQAPGVGRHADAQVGVGVRLVLDERAGDDRVAVGADRDRLAELRAEVGAVKRGAGGDAARHDIEPRGVAECEVFPAVVGLVEDEHGALLLHDRCADDERLAAGRNLHGLAEARPLTGDRSRPELVDQLGGGLSRAPVDLEDEQPARPLLACFALRVPLASAEEDVADLLVDAGAGVFPDRDARRFAEVFLLVAEEDLGADLGDFAAGFEVVEVSDAHVAGREVAAGRGGGAGVVAGGADDEGAAVEPPGAEAVVVAGQRADPGAGAGELVDEVDAPAPAVLPLL